MNIVIDTNIVISGVFFGGYPKKILEAVIDGRFYACSNKEILNEYYEIINEMIDRKQGRINKKILDEFIASVHVIKSSSSFDICRDPDDNKFINCAVDAAALYITSGDKDLLDIGNFRNIQIVTAKFFCEKFIES